MISFNTPNISNQIHTGILVNRHITVQAVAELTRYNNQYLRRMLRTGRLKGVKIGQLWLIEMQSLGSYLQRVENTTDRSCGPK